MPTSRIIESTVDAFAILDAYPASPGHTLIIPRRHVASAFDLTVDEITSLLHLIQAARERIDRTLKPTGYNVGVNVGRDAGQTVMHVHIHVIPRYPGDVADPAGGVRRVIPGKGRWQAAKSE
jgi:diadenosine tetraphosphate (Ap4A) HIT family hydrolase